MKLAQVVLVAMSAGLLTALAFLSFTPGYRVTGAAASVDASVGTAGTSGADLSVSGESSHQPRTPAAASGAETPGGAVVALNEVTSKLESARVFEKDDRTLEQKYAGATHAQLLAARSLLMERRDARREEIGKEMLAADRLVLRPSGGSEPEARTGNPDGSPLTTVDSFEWADGVSVVRSATISGEEYPDYRALELEVWWLQCKLHELKKAGSGR